MLEVDLHADVPDVEVLGLVEVEDPQDRDGLPEPSA
jgi:hypothetical protein